MGIRGILGILLNGLGSSVLKLIPPDKRGFPVSRMYIDMIQFAYKALAAINADALMAGVPPNLDDDNIIARAVTIVLNVIREISPRAFLGIYFDGIPPMAKVVEQRARRYEMERPAAGHFNKAKNTVGTAFLRKLVEKVMAGLAENASLLPSEVEISTPAERGEGEHKLATRIRDKDASLRGVKVIVADDGDVMIMALLNSWKDCYIYVDLPPPNPRHGLVNISAIAERIKYRLNDTPTAIYDFCLMVILTGGNDFMPTIMSARDRRGILNELMDLYGSVLRGQPLMTNQGREIVWSSVRALVNELATNEERNLRDVARKAQTKLEGKMPAIFTRSTDPKTAQIRLALFRKAWDEELYEPKVDSSRMPEGIIVPRPTQSEIDADHAYSAIQYLQGLSWTLAYMKTGDGPNWYYEPPYPPLFGDIARVMAGGTDPIRELRSLPPWEPLDLPVYLLTVLPRWAVTDLFGSTFENAFGRGAGIGDLFPQHLLHFAPGEWDETRKGRAILPPLGLERLEKVVKERIDVEIAERNMKALQPLVRFSRSQGRWVSTTVPKAPTKTACTDYEILDLVIPNI